MKYLNKKLFLKNVNLAKLLITSKIRYCMKKNELTEIDVDKLISKDVSKEIS